MDRGDRTEAPSADLRRPVTTAGPPTTPAGTAGATVADDGPVFPAAPPGRIEIGDGLVLVKPDPDLAEAVAAAVNESLDHLRPWMAWAQEPTTIEARRSYLMETVAQWDARRDFSFVLVHEPSGRIAGGCGLHARLGRSGLEVGYWVHVDWIGRGVATAMARALTAAAFAIDGIERVRISCADDNVRSARVPTKLGFRHLGTWVPDEGVCEGQATQHWEIARADWLAHPG